jgi:hypothetical protein
MNCNGFVCSLRILLTGVITLAQLVAVEQSSRLAFSPDGRGLAAAETLRTGEPADAEAVGAGGKTHLIRLFRPSDGRFISSEWLGYVARHVPEIFSAVKRGRRRLIVRGRPITYDLSRGVRPACQGPVKGLFGVVA